MAVVEFFFDCSSPWTYLGFSRIRPVCRAVGAEIVWKPILVGGIFNTVNPGVYEQRENPNPLKAAYAEKDLADWASFCGVRIAGIPPVFPVRAVKAMRGAIHALDKGCLEEYALAVFARYWGDFEDISQDSVLMSVCQQVGLVTDEYFAAIADPDIKARLRANTEEVMARGGFGSPTIFVDGDDMYFGNDRIPLVEAALRR
jgi:2-hydroxychromene-2-carboxylate isomerase